MERVISPSQKIIRFITRNAIVAAMYYAFTMLMVFLSSAPCNVASPKSLSS